MCRLPITIAMAGATALLIFNVGRCPAAPTPTAERARLDEITSRGLMLVTYDRAAEAGNKAVAGIRPDPRRFEYFLANPDSATTSGAAGWTVLFASLHDNGDRLEAAYSAQGDPATGDFAATAYPSPVVVTGRPVAAFRALAHVRQQFGETASRPTNYFVLDEPGTGNLLVYAIPAQTSKVASLLGPDARFTFLADGRTLLDRRNMHDVETIVVVPADAEFTSHTTTLAGGPEDTDVFHVMTRPGKKTPDVVTGPEGLAYTIAVDGTISTLATDIPAPPIPVGFPEKTDSGTTTAKTTSAYAVDTATTAPAKRPARAASKSRKR